MISNVKRQLCLRVAPILFAFVPPACLAEPSEASVTPYRPTVSNPAALSAPGWLEVEFGANRQTPGDGSRRTSYPFLMKYAFDEDFGMLLGGDAHVRAVDNLGATSAGRGDTTFQFKHRWGLSGSDAALGLEWGIKAPTAPDTLGTGKADYLVNGIYSRGFGNYTLDLNLGLTRLGSAPVGGTTQVNWAGSLSREIAPGWSVAGELSGSGRRGQRGDGQALVAVGYAISPRVVLDAGFSVGTTRNAPDRSVFLGVSFLVERIR